ncbi:glycosyltransferase family 2 protein [Gelidibacter gilvus]|uniref:Glycosyltransferase family 2 protein n=1 Tax=Gelidibacter gilvus TaxID=59602 RepID=A0A4Q0XDI2_9FLAO|nr:glycosyltransferase family A protein [Gelidibacter gilvus]RXJ45410.1 glycosyltransferase family 2 protein [Gelidibacter gilvus]
MIIVYHHNNKVASIFDHQLQEDILVEENHILKTLMHLATLHNNRILVWCRLDCKEQLNHVVISNSFKIKNIMLSYGKGFYIPEAIGYVEDSPFIKVNPSVKYGTFLMSSTVGAIHSETLLKFRRCNFPNDFAFALNSIAKLGMPHGLFCYSEPKLILSTIETVEKRAGVYTLFRFVKQHYRARWVFLLALNFWWHESKVTLLPLLNSLLYKRRSFNTAINLEANVECETIELPSIDVIIPTIGRPNYLKNVLKDLTGQTHLPNKVIIVEQNPEEGSKTSLDFIYSESWPYKVDHHFIHQTGVCNARNIALQQVVSEFVYLADDDNKFDEGLIETVLIKMLKFDLDVISMSYLQKNEREKRKFPLQWGTFGAGSSVLKSKFLANVSFNEVLEFGYGEDVDFGMQLRNVGADIIYFPSIQILHLKAPIGGFRTTFKQPWLEDKIQPKPTPTVMFNRMTNTSEKQLLGYKTILCLNYYFSQEIKNPIRYYKFFIKEWNQSVFWANKLKNSNT